MRDEGGGNPCSSPAKHVSNTFPHLDPLLQAHHPTLIHTLIPCSSSMPRSRIASSSFASTSTYSEGMVTWGGGREGSGLRVQGSGLMGFRNSQTCTLDNNRSVRTGGKG